MRHRKVVGALALGIVSATAGGALAVRNPDNLTGETGLVTVGVAARGQRTSVWHQAPARTEPAWRRFLAAHGGAAAWTAIFDGETGVAHRVFGRGIAAPGAVDDPARAEAAARAAIADHLDLLAPGATATDLVVAANERSGDLRTVAFFQTHRGMRVIGGQVSVRIKRDQIFVLASTALPAIDAPAVTASIADDVAQRRALAWLADVAPAATTGAGSVTGPMVLPIVSAGRGTSYHTVVAVRVDSDAPIAQWDVYLDAVTGAPVAREQRLRFGQATVNYDAPRRWWGAERADFPAYEARVIAAGVNTAATLSGVVMWAGTGNAALTMYTAGDDVNVSNDAGAEASFAATATSGGTVRWTAPTDQFVDAQITTFIHGALVKAWARTVSDISWLAGPLQATVNINDTCNAFSDGDTINFFRSSAQCGNTARIADVVYHEFGHSFHNNAIIQGAGAWDGALSEGLGDFVAATITGDPAMGLGFFNSAEPLRHCDPAGSEFVWPDDIAGVHDTGRIYCGAMFDLRKNLIALYGETQGRAVVDELFYESFRRADDIPATYVELLAWDDDDGDLANGTPHKCEIDDAYARHGMADPSGDSGPRTSPPTRDEAAIHLPVFTSQLCQSGNVTGAMLEWKIRGGTSAGGSVAMTAAADGFDAVLPETPWGEVVQYKVTVTTEAGGTIVYPANAADPWYEAFFGEVSVLYCTDFEADPTADGWAHALVSGDNVEGADDWQWGAPLGESGDPSAAFSGASVYGNDLGADNYNGAYQDNKVNHLVSPAVDVSGWDVVRLQYRRWLNVEDGASDVGAIFVADQLQWSNLAEGAAPDHTDHEWRFHDVDLTAAAAAGSIQVEWRLTTNGGGQLGGWTLDDVCIVAYNRPACGDGAVAGDEACDDGNTVDGDGCSAACTTEEDPDDPDDPGDPDDPDDPADGDGSAEGGCGCQGSGAGGGAWLAGLLALALLRRDRRQRARR